MEINNLKMIYYGLVNYFLEYGCIGWGGIYKSNIYPLEITQKRILKLMFNKPFDYPTAELFKLSSMFSIRQIYVKTIFLNWYRKKITSNHISHTYFTRGQKLHQVYAFKSNSRLGQRFYEFFLHKLLNELDPMIKNNIHSIGTFKKYLNKWILDHYEIIKSIF